MNILNILGDKILPIISSSVTWPNVSLYTYINYIMPKIEIPLFYMDPIMML